MNVHERIQEITNLYGHAASLELTLQPILRKYVTDKNVPLEERFPIWTRYGHKEDHGTSNVPGVIGFLLSNGYGEWPLFGMITHDTLLDENEAYHSSPEDFDCVYISEDDFMEALMDENFGFCTERKHVQETTAY